MAQKYKFIELSAGEWVQAIFEAGETSTLAALTHFDFKDLTDGTTVQVAAFVDNDGNKIKLT